MRELPVLAEICARSHLETKHSESSRKGATLLSLSSCVREARTLSSRRFGPLFGGWTCKYQSIALHTWCLLQHVEAKLAGAIPT
jgi:hypothetical protein